VKLELFTLVGVLAAGAALILLSKQSNLDAMAGDGTFFMPNITQDPATWPAGDRIWDICRAVALAEGYNRGPGAAPFDLNNPGDLSPGDEGGFPTAGAPHPHGGSYVIHFATANDGWQALYYKFRNIASGASTVYSPGWSWAQIAALYAGDAASWLRNVTTALGVDPASSLASYVGVL
jgi:hypothetical protein